MKIRTARIEDAPALAALVNPVIAETTVTFTTQRHDTASMRAAIVARRPACLVAERSGEVVAHAAAFPFRGGPGYARIREHTVIVAPAARRSGAGRGLMVELESVLASQGVHSLVAAISGENPEARAFHVALGFAEVGRLPEAGWKFGRFIDLVLMQKMVGPAT